jgi:hypothetical protein
MKHRNDSTSQTATQCTHFLNNNSTKKRRYSGYGNWILLETATKTASSTKSFA